MEEEEEKIESPQPTQHHTQEKEEQVMESPQLAQEKKEEQIESPWLAQNDAEGKEEEQDVESPWPTQMITQQNILVEAYTQTEPPSVKDACIETSSFQKLKGIWTTEHEVSQGKAFQQKKGTWLSYAYRNWEALE